MEFSLKLFLIFVLATISLSDPDPNFYIFLAIGQSNMEGQGPIEQEDIDEVTDRFKMMPAIDMPLYKREKHNWYKATPPLCRQWSHISPLDNFGRTLARNLPEEISVGVINVAVGGASIDVFDDDKSEEFVKNTEDYIQAIAAEYGNHPFRILIDAAKKAQESGVIKGVLVHQGESNNGEETWPEKIKLIYERILSELNLNSEDVPLLIGELMRKEQGGECYAHNKIIAKVPEVIPNSYVISSEGCENKGDGYHFSTEGNRLLGKRYGEQWLKINGYDVKEEEEDDDDESENIKEEVDPNFYIFLAFGQSNMEGEGDIEEEDLERIPDRFKLMSALNFTTFRRKAGKWYKPIPPLCKDNANLSPLDYFGRTLVEKLPEDKKVGVINVALGGASIVAFDEDRAESYFQTTEDWVQKDAELYGNNPFRVLVETAKKAQKYGVIKGILLHQGESDTGDKNWINNVKIVYYNLLSELGLLEEDVPLLVGELVSNSEGGLCYPHNEIIGTIGEVLKNVYVIPSEGCPSKLDGYHFNSQGYRILGRRYGETMYEYLKNHGF